MEVRNVSSRDGSSPIIIVEVDYWYGKQTLQLTPRQAGKIKNRINEELVGLEYE